MLTSEKLINLNYFALDKLTCLQDMVALLAENEIISSKENFLTKILEREEMMSTGIGKKIAIPHARSNAVTKLSIVFFRIKNELDFEAIDDEPVNLIFMIAIPESMNKDYMKILQAISNFCHDNKNIDQLYNAETAVEANLILSRIVPKL